MIILPSFRGFYKPASVVSGPFVPNAVSYNNNSYLTRIPGAIPDSTGGTISYWINCAGLEHVMLSFGGVGYVCYQSSQVYLFGYSTFNSTTVISTGVWHHIFSSWNTSTLTRNIYFDGSAVALSPGTNNNGVLPYATYGILIGSYTGNNYMVNGSICEFWFDNTYVDPATNITKFRSLEGKPVNLGTNGETPTGTSPKIYLKSNAANYGVNSGTAGNLTKAGAATFTDVSPP